MAYGVSLRSLQRIFEKLTWKQDKFGDATAQVNDSCQLYVFRKSSSTVVGRIQFGDRKSAEHFYVFQHVDIEREDTLSVAIAISVLLSTMRDGATAALA